MCCGCLYVVVMVVMESDEVLEVRMYFLVMMVLSVVKSLCFVCRFLMIVLIMMW